MKSSIKNISIKLFISCFVLCSVSVLAQVKSIAVEDFDKVIVSPHISVSFVQGSQNKVEVHSSTEPLEKLNVEVVANTLRLYLDGAKTYTDSKKEKGDNYSYSNPIYKGTVITATVTYTQLEELSLRGEEKFVCESPLKQDKFRLKIFGESQVSFKEVVLQSLMTTIYGESFLEIEGGVIAKQKITAYGETTVNTLDVATKETKITAYGEGSYRIAVSERLKVTAYGEATIAYSGSPEINKGIIIGDATIQKID